MMACGPDERALLRGSGHAAGVSPELELCHVLFEQRVAAHPSKEAVICDRRTLTYAELNTRANQIAHSLQRRGVGPEAPVVLCLRRSVELIATYLGVLKAGGAVFLLDPDMPSQRVKTMLEVIQPTVVVSEEPVDARRLGMSRPPISVPDLLDPSDAKVTTRPRNRIELGNALFLLATSGSTGIPKIVIKPLGHRRVATGYESADGGVSSDDRHLLKTDSGTGFAHAEITRPLLTGGTLLIAPEGAEYDAAALAGFIADHRVSHLLATPSQLLALLDVDDIDRCTSLRSVDCIGEIVSPALAEHFFRTFKACSLIVSYGCTEALGATSRACSEGDPPVASVGRPSPLMEVFVVDARLQLCAVGVPGDVYVGGELARGYVRNPRETALRFVPHLFRPGARLFRTGDVGRWLSDGALEILGRRDRQVKVRGHRVELDEIEAALRQCPGVKQAAVELRDDESGRQRIVGYAIEGTGRRIDSRECRNQLTERLPQYMVPSPIVVLSQFPLTANGKLDRSALPAPRASDRRTSADDPPRGELEEALAAVWIEVLGVDHVGRHDDFFALGGHSLLVAQLVGRIRQEFSVEFGVLDVFARPVFADLASDLEALLLWR
jgi:amino acid adenylation domain-containing protein